MVQQILGKIGGNGRTGVLELTKIYKKIINVVFFLQILKKVRKMSNARV